MIVVEFINPSDESEIMVAEDDEHFARRFATKYPGKEVPSISGSDRYISNCQSLEKVKKAMTGLVGFNSPEGRRVLEPLYDLLDEIILNERRVQREEAVSSLAKAMSFDAQDHRPTNAERE